MRFWKEKPPPFTPDFFDEPVPRFRKRGTGIITSITVVLPSEEENFESSPRQTAKAFRHHPAGLPFWMFPIQVSRGGWFYDQRFTKNITNASNKPER
jgi:hypothetical protein